MWKLLDQPRLLEAMTCDKANVVADVRVSFARLKPYVFGCC
jgi:hypothetical protein